jgi:hypothetical protein
MVFIRARTSSRLARSSRSYLIKQPAREQPGDRVAENEHGSSGQAFFDDGVIKEKTNRCNHQRYRRKEPPASPRRKRVPRNSIVFQSIFILEQLQPCPWPAKQFFTNLDFAGLRALLKKG